MDKNKANITINWKGKENKRGLTELALQTMRYVGSQHNRPTLMEEADKLSVEYERAKETLIVKGIRQLNLFSWTKELEMVRQYVKVRL